MKSLKPGQSRGFIHIITILIVVVALVGIGVFATVKNQVPANVSASAGYALQFYGNGDNDIDRVKIPVDNPPTKADIGTQDFTIEWWMNASGSSNSGSASCGSGFGWITGNTIFDRDIFGGADNGDFGISLSGGRIAFGVGSINSEYTLCGNINVADNAWHHVVVTRSTGGQMRIFVDGQLDQSFNGPTGDISYRDNRFTSYPNSDPYLVIGAEKHDAGSAYPSYSGLIDEVRISNAVRYTANFQRPSAPFTADSNTLVLYHFDEGGGTAVVDSAANPLNGQLRVGGSPQGPIYVQSTAPLGTSTSTPSPTSTPTPTSMVTSTPSPTGQPVSGLIAGYSFENVSGTNLLDRSGNGNNLTMVGSPATQAGRYGNGMRFDGSDDRAARGGFTLPSTFTLATWLNNPSNQSYETVMTVGSNRDLYLTNETLRFYDGQTERSFGAVPTSGWHHVAVVYDGSALRAYLNGTQLGSSQNVALGSYSSTLQLGAWVMGNSNYDFLNATLDDVRIYNRALTTADLAIVMANPLESLPSPTPSPTASPTPVSTQTPTPTPSPSPTPVPTPSPTPVPTATPTPGPISANLLGAYSFNSLDGTNLLDSSGNGRNLTVIGSPAIVTGRYGNGMRFDGLDDRAARGAFTLPAAFTIMAWINNASNQSYETFLTVGSNRDFYLQNGGVGYYNGSSEYRYGSVSVGTWNHVAITSTGSQMRFFVNGVQVGQTSLSVAAQTNSLQLGAWIFGANNVDYLSAILDEVRIYDRALSASEITSAMGSSL